MFNKKVSRFAGKGLDDSVPIPGSCPHCKSNLIDRGYYITKFKQVVCLRCGTTFESLKG